MGKQKFAELLIDHLFPLIAHSHFHIFQGQALHARAVRALLDQRDQRGLRIHHRMPHGPGHSISISGGTGQRIGAAPCGQNHPTGLQSTAVFQFDPGYVPFLRQQSLCPALVKRDFFSAQCIEERVNYICRPVRGGENPISPLRLELQSQTGKKLHGFFRGKLLHRTVQEFCIAWDILQHFRRRTVVRQIAPAFSGDIELAPQLLIALDQQHRGTRANGGVRSQHTGSASADDDHRRMFFQCKPPK